MELDKIQDAFDRVHKKQKLSSSKTQELVDQIGLEIEQAMTKIQSTENISCSDPKSILVDLKAKLNEIAPMNQLEVLQKDLNVTLGKYVRLLEKNFIPDISKAHRNVDFDVRIVNQIIASHFYRQGLFDLGDCFIREANEPEASALKSPFLDMYKILEAMRCRNLEPALSWASKQSEWLMQNGSNLELKLHQLQFVEILQNGSKRQVAINYAKKYLAPFASAHKVEIPKLMGCLLWPGRLHESPYADFMSPNHWEKLAEEFIQQFCSHLGHSYQSPLSVTIGAGVQGLPTLLKLESVMARKQEWQAMKQLPVPVDLGSEFQFHSIFVCPVLREQASDENPPMLMPCGHVLSKQSIAKLSKNNTRAFKCPYCPLEASSNQCRQLHF
ncbi:hypothetical protein Cni_G00227 [Canna indica]|uniref:Uncharacterized protein n=1 Tax=Canna indica TaxID=4628 RepID=A0AAQ3JKL1_9LILI|nr:hypothetical protein Cni_G00227 [Canna indica]